MRIAFVIHSMQAGGMERVMWQLLTYGQDHFKGEMHLVLFGKKPELFFQPPSKVIIHQPNEVFNENRRLISTIKRLVWLRRTIRKISPYSILSFGEYWNNMVLLACLGLRQRVYVSDRAQPNKTLGRVHDWLRKILYPRANGIIAQTNYAANHFKTLYKSRSIQVIGNPINEIPCSSGNRKKQILMVGRLIRSKHQDQLIEIFSKLNAPDWELILVGHDHLKQENQKDWEKLASNLGVGDRVRFEGRRANVEEYYCQASIFAFTSSSEGFPNVIGEAMSAELPVISYDCAAGPSEMIIDGENGFLIPLFDKAAFREKLQLLIDDPVLRESMGCNGVKKIREFQLNSIAFKYYNILTNP